MCNGDHEVTVAIEQLFNAVIAVVPDIIIEAIIIASTAYDYIGPILADIEALKDEIGLLNAQPLPQPENAIPYPPVVIDIQENAIPYPPIAVNYPPINNIHTGSYTPTLTDGANVTSSASAVCMYVKIDDIVTVYGQFSLEATVSVTLTDIEIELPISSIFSAITDCSGVGSSQYDSGRISGILVNNTAKLSFIASSILDNDWSFNFSYRILS